MPEESVKAGNATNNKPSTRVFLSSIAWSSDGTGLAYVRSFETAPPGPSEYKHSLLTVDLNGRMLKVVKVSRQLLPVTFWAADGRLLYGYRDDPASDRLHYGIWSVRVSQKSGEPEGKEMQVTQGPEGSAG